MNPSAISRAPACCALAALICAAAAAHEVRPAYLQIAPAPGGGTAGTEYKVLWKQPLASNRLLPLTPVFPEHCELAAVAVDTVADDALVQRFRLDCAGGLRGGTIVIDGLSRTITDVMLQLTLADGTRLAKLLKPASPAFVVDESAAAPVLDYLALGVEHLLFGFDHILFVLSLLFFLTRPAALAKAVTAFTAAHSTTLAFSALEWVRLPQAPVEAAIALSILFLAVEKLRRTQRSITAEHTWVVAFAFGLLHGFGFAGALADLGLPKDNVLPALLLFNIGVEIGQLALVAVALATIWAVRRTRIEVPRWVVETPLYASGCLAAYWFVSRTAAVVA